MRYHVFGPVPWDDLPFFILNKGLCLAAFILLVMNFAFGPLKNLGAAVPDGWLNARKALGDSGDAQLYISTVRGRGFRFVAEVVEHVRVDHRHR